MAQRRTATPLPAWAGDLSVIERRWPNGLTGLVLRRPQAPVVVCDLYYPVGSADDPPGRSGLAHFVEHMLFKGTDRLPKGQIDRLAFLAAGQSNAETAEDCTHYWFAFPRDGWELALAIEADRMRGAIFDPREVDAERQVIAEERARELDSPLGRLDQAHLTHSYLTHPYRNPILGWPEEVRRLSAAELTEFYRAHYRPDGAVVVVVGDVEPSAALERIGAHLGVLSAGTASRPGPPDEPAQCGRRAFVLEETEGVVRGLMGWHTVPRGHPDAPALEVLADLLCCGRRSRLWWSLVEERRLATWVDASQEGAQRAGQFLIQIEGGPRSRPGRLERAVDAVLEGLIRRGPHAEELARSRNRLEAAWRWEQEDLAGLALGLGSAALWGDWRSWPADHRRAMAVTADDVRRVARTYLTERNLTVGWSIPSGGKRALVALPAAPAARAPAPATIELPGDWFVGAVRVARLDDYRPTRLMLPNGLRLLMDRRPSTGTVALELYVEAGQITEARPGLAHLAGRLREEGTRGRSAEELAAAIEDVGGTMEVGATGASLRVRSEDLGLAVELAADLTLRPAFPAAELAWLKRRIAAERAGEADDPAFRAEMAFRRLIYGRHPYGRDPRGSARQLAALTLEDVKEHHRRCYVPSNAFLVAAGDFEPGAMAALVGRQFGGWKAGPPAEFPRHPRPRLGPARVKRVDAAGEQVHIVLGHLGITRLDPDHDALVVLDHILGCGPGFTDRLSRLIRDELGLAYTVGGGITESADVEPGSFRIYLGTRPSEAERAVEAVLEQVRAVHRGAFEDAEVHRARDYLAGSWVFDFQTVSQRAERLLEMERWGMPPDEPLRWADRLARVTPEQVRAAARRHLHPDRVVRVEYGPIDGRG